VSFLVTPGPEDERDEQQKTTPWGAEQETTPYGSSGAGRPSAETEILIGREDVRLLGERYDVLAEIGRGGMGVVYRARDRETGDVVALKVLRPDIARRPDLIARFKSELLLARRITHKNVCRVYELLRFGESAVIAMEYVEGESMRAILARSGGVPVRRGLEWARQMCSALAEAHAQGVVHRDLKPENILIANDGTAKVMDFGIARSVSAEVTVAGSVVGTPAYMSPEQVEGKRADARSDIYALGLILYEIFTGQTAFGAETPNEFLARHIHATPPPLREVDPYLPAFLDRAIQRCLRKDPAKRFQSIGELEAALAAKPEDHVQEWASRRHMVFAGALVLALGLVGGFFLGKTWPSWQSGMSHNSVVYSVAFSRDGRWLASASEDKTIKIWDVAKEREVRTLAGHTRAVASVTFSHDGRWLASGAADRKVKLWDPVTGKEAATLEGHSRAVQAVAFSPNGPLLASGDTSGMIQLWDVGGRKPKHGLKGHTDAVNAVAFSSDGRLLASAGDDETVRIWEVGAGRGLLTFKDHPDAVLSVSFSPDSRWLASSDAGGGILIWESKTGEVLRSLKGHKDWTRAVAFSPDGSQLASAGDDGKIYLWDTATGNVLRTLAEGKEVFRTVAFSSDGHLLASGDTDGAVRIWQVQK